MADSAALARKATIGSFHCCMMLQAFEPAHLILIILCEWHNAVLKIPGEHD